MEIAKATKKTQNDSESLMVTPTRIGHTSATPELRSWQQVARRRFVSKLPQAVFTPIALAITHIRFLL